MTAKTSVDESVNRREYKGFYVRYHCRLKTSNLKMSPFWCQQKDEAGTETISGLIDFSNAKNVFVKSLKLHGATFKPEDLPVFSSR